MNEKKRDVLIVEKIIKYCREVQETIALFGNVYEMFVRSSIYQNAVSMCVLQIGELVGVLSDEAKKVYNEMPWKQIRGMRNMIVHHYGSVDIDELWHTITEDIPNLSRYSEKILQEMRKWENE